MAYSIQYSNMLYRFIAYVRGEAEENVERLVAQSDDNLHIMRSMGHVVLVCNLKTKWAGMAQTV
jgi:hypothetical protein